MAHPNLSTGGDADARPQTPDAVAVWAPRALGAAVIIAALLWVLPDSGAHVAARWADGSPSTSFAVDAGFIVVALATVGGVLFAWRKPAGWWLVVSLGGVFVVMSSLSLLLLTVLDLWFPRQVIESLVGLLVGGALIALVRLPVLGGPGARAWTPVR